MFLEEFVGQHKLKQSLSFYHDGYKNDGYMPTICFNAPKGEGKTLILKSIAQELAKKTLLINCGSIKNTKSFADNVLMPVAIDPDPVTVLLDEIHALPTSCQVILLTVLAPSKDRKNTYTHIDGGNQFTMVFDFHRITFLVATTNLEKLLAPLQDRLKIFSFEDYSEEDIAKIIERNSRYLIEPNFLREQVVKFVRINPRSAILLSDDIEIYCKGQGKKFFGQNEWEALKKTLNLRPFGLYALEEKLLRIIRDSKGGAKLTYLASYMSLDNRAVQGLERYLVSRGLVHNDQGRRFLTEKGVEYFS